MVFIDFKKAYNKVLKDVEARSVLVEDKGDK